MIVDFHNHYYPPEYLNALQEGPSNYTVTFDTAGNPVLHSPGDRNYVVPGHRDIEFREKVLKEAGVDLQVLSFTAPGTTIEVPERSVQLCRLVNNVLAGIVKERGRRFTALATLPLNDPVASVAELERTKRELGFKGCMVFSSVNGTPLYDRIYWPLLEKASELRSVLYIHPNFPAGVESMGEYWLMPLVGFMFDTTLTAAGLVFSGVVERFPNIRWVLAHLGGALPYIAERLDRGYHAFAECRAHISRPPSEYIRQFYFDTVNFDPAALRLAIDFAGADHLLAGSDYPHQIGSLEGMLESIRELGLDERDERRILGRNTLELLEVDVS